MYCSRCIYNRITRHSFRSPNLSYHKSISQVAVTQNQCWAISLRSCMQTLGFMRKDEHLCGSQMVVPSVVSRRGRGSSKVPRSLYVFVTSDQGWARRATAEARCLQRKVQTLLLSQRSLQGGHRTVSTQEDRHQERDR